MEKNEIRILEQYAKISKESYDDDGNNESFYKLDKDTYCSIIEPNKPVPKISEQEQSNLIDNKNHKGKIKTQKAIITQPKQYTQNSDKNYDDRSDIGIKQSGFTKEDAKEMLEGYKGPKKNWLLRKITAFPRCFAALVSIILIIIANIPLFFSRQFFSSWKWLGQEPMFAILLMGFAPLIITCAACTIYQAWQRKGRTAKALTFLLNILCPLGGIVVAAIYFSKKSHLWAEVLHDPTPLYAIALITCVVVTMLNLAITKYLRKTQESNSWDDLRKTRTGSVLSDHKLIANQNDNQSQLSQDNSNSLIETISHTDTSSTQSSYH